jgi:hypothetical protein
VDWRRKDSTYAAATAVAAALVAYVVAGNFGLVPSPLLPPALGGATPVAVAPIGAAATGTPGPSPSRGPSATPGRTSSPTAVPTAAPPRDTIAPTGAFTTQDGVSVPVDQGATVSGTASDAGSGVRDVLVTFSMSAGTSTTRPADLNCNASRSSCTWTAKIPATVGSYTITAQLRDRSGNKRNVGPINVTVVNAGGVVDDLLGNVGSLLGV